MMTRGRKQYIHKSDLCYLILKYNLIKNWFPTTTINREYGNSSRTLKPMGIARRMPNLGLFFLFQGNRCAVRSQMLVTSALIQKKHFNLLLGNSL